MRIHITTWQDGARTRSEEYPICGQANTHASVVLAPGETSDSVTCRRCAKRWAEKGDGHDARSA